MSRHAFLGTLPRQRYTDAEWAQIQAGVCVEQTSYGTGQSDRYCTERAPDGHVLCPAHQHQFVANTGHRPGPGGF